MKETLPPPVLIPDAEPPKEPAVADERRPDHIARSGQVRFLAILLAVGVGMFAFAFANAPLFVMICQKIGLLPPALSEAKPAVDAPNPNRPLSIYFLANSNGMPIVFTSKDRVQDLSVGARGMNDYRFVNMTNETIYFRPVHDVSPRSAGHESIMTLEKCFCFDVQRIGPREEYVLPVVYRFGEKLEADVTQITMAYTLFPSTKEDYEESLKSGGTHNAGGKAPADNTLSPEAPNGGS